MAAAASVGSGWTPVSGRGDGERRARAFARALGADRAAVQLDQLLDDRQAQPQAAVAAGGGGVGLAEAVEHVRQELGRDALAGVGRR